MSAGVLFLFFFFKQKTAYEMRISDWSSDVCSSDLLKENVIVGRLVPAGTGAGMNRLRIAATSRDAALRAQQKKLQEALIAANSAEEERKAELAQDPVDAMVTSDALEKVEVSGDGSDEAAGEYPNKED